VKIIKLHYLLIPLIVTLLISACAKTVVTPATGSLKVPLYHQGKKECGPTSLLMVLGYYGVDLSREDVQRGLHFNYTLGITQSEMANFSYWNYGLKASKFMDADIGMIEEAITNGTPVLVAYVSSATTGHWSVVVGYNRDKQVLILNDPGCGCLRSFSYKKFLSVWQNPAKGHRRYMVIISKDERTTDHIYNNMSLNDLQIPVKKEEPSVNTDQQYKPIKSTTSPDQSQQMPAKKAEPSVNTDQQYKAIKDTTSPDQSQQMPAKKADPSVNTDQQYKAIKDTTSPDKSQQMPAKKDEYSVNADPKYNTIKGIVLINGNIIEGQIISMNPDIVKIRTKDGKVLSYDFKYEVQKFITE